MNANMTNAPKRYWRGLDELAQSEEFKNSLHREFPEHPSEWLEGMDRRHFLKITSATLALAGLTACTRQPAERIVPYVKQPEELVPGKPLFFATAMPLGGFAAGLLVESHEGHPTKIEGNPDHPMSLGATNVFHQASLLDLYDPDRSQAILNGGEISSWETFLSDLNDALRIQQTKGGGGLRILTETVASPTLYAQIQAILEKFPGARWHQYEPINRDNVYEGARLAFGEIFETHYHFDKAKIIVSLDSDFLFSHPASLRYAREFINARRVNVGRDEGNRLYVVESTPTITGSNADHRLPLASGEIEYFARGLAQELGAIAPSASYRPNPAMDKWIKAVAGDLQQNRGAAVIIAGDQQPPIIHALAHVMNHFLGNAGSTVSYTSPILSSPLSQVESLQQLNDDLKNGNVYLLVILGGNPVFNAPVDFYFEENLMKAKLRVHLGADVNETSAYCQWHIPQNHFLESWSDARAFDGTASIIQPLIFPLYAGKSAHELLDALWQTQSRSDYEIVRAYWQSQNHWPDFEKGWRRALHDGLIEGTANPAKNISLQALSLAPAVPDVKMLELTFHPDPTLWDGRFANNGWLQELPKPISKLTWDNPALISPELARRENLSSGDMVELEFQNNKLRMPVWVTPGQAENSIALTLGYGRSCVGHVGQGTGFDTYHLRTSGAFWSGTGVTLRKTGDRYGLASTQTEHVIDSDERQIFRETTLADFLLNPKLIEQSTETPSRADTLFKPQEHDYEGYHWGMAIDLTACIGCNACIIACQAENNIPVVGKDQVARHRAMHWLRVDSYFSGSADAPQISHQPVPCMHCENAPCELVCPVGATVHDHEGLNLQVYNRCIGTRYCSNNCPYKVRRFNFYQYADNKTPSLKPMRNPNVTVRSRGVMEKCTYCIQRISVARIQSKLDGRKIADGEIKTACQQVCPAEAIVFGDISDLQSRVSKLKAHALNFSMLGQLNTRPRTTYSAKVRNPNPELAT